MVTGLGVSKAKLFKGRYEPKSKFPEGWWMETRKKKHKTICEGEGGEYFLEPHIELEELELTNHLMCMCSKIQILTVG